MKEEIRFIELTEESADEANKFCVSSFGEEGSGKTHFGGTLPSPIGVVALDRKTRKTIIKSAKLHDKKIIIPDIDFIRVNNPMQLAMMADDCGKHKKPEFGSEMPVCCSSHYYRWHVNRVKQAAFTLVEMPEKKCRSIVIDSGTQFKEDVMFANYGRSQKVIPRDRGAFNQEMIDFMNALSSKHVLITHKAKDVWKNENKTGEQERNGFNQMGYHVNIEIRHWREKKKSKDGSRPFYVDIGQCQANPEIVGDKMALEDDSINFQQLALLVYPDSDSDLWE